MKKIIILNVLVQSCFLHCMEDRPKDGQIVSKNDYFRPINPEVEKRHNVAKWHVDFACAVVLNKRNEVSQMLVDAGEDANELVCTASSAYGSILKSTYVEQQPEMRKLLKKYMDDAYLKQCFELEKAGLKQTWEFNASQKNS